MWTDLPAVRPYDRPYNDRHSTYDTLDSGRARVTRLWSPRYNCTTTKLHYCSRESLRNFGIARPGLFPAGVSTRHCRSAGHGERSVLLLLKGNGGWAAAPRLLQPGDRSLDFSQRRYWISVLAEIARERDIREAALATIDHPPANVDATCRTVYRLLF